MPREHKAPIVQLRPFTAQFEFICMCCENRFPAGTLAYYGVEDEIFNANTDHDLYVTTGEEFYQEDENGRREKIEVMPRGKSPADRCNRCFLVHSTGQSECE